MKVLLCTPYLQGPNIVSGGINIWGHNVWNYYQQVDSELELDIVSFDRIFNVQEDSSIFQRLHYGIKDYSRPIKEIKNKLKQNGRYDVLHLCTSAQLGLFKDWVIIREAHRRGVKVALHLHFGRVPELLKKQNLESKLFKMVVSMADAVIAIDSPSYKTLIENGYRHAFYLPNPLSLSIIQQIKEEQKEVKRIPGKILFVGHVIPTKGIYELAIACNGMPNVELHYIGTITEEVRSKLDDEVRCKNNGKWMKIRGAKPHEEVIREMLSCDLFVLPSYTEGFPNVILEAMACGCAIVATNVGAIPEMLEAEDGKQCGILVNPCNSDELMTAMNTVIKDEEQKEHLRENATMRVNERYSMPIVWVQLTSIWNKTNQL